MEGNQDHGIQQVSLAGALKMECRDARYDMLCIIEQELRLKLEVREMKSDFLHLLKTFDYYNHLDQKYAKLILGDEASHEDRPTTTPSCETLFKYNEEKGLQRFVANIQSKDKLLKERAAKRKAQEMPPQCSDISSISQNTTSSSQLTSSSDCVIGPLHSTLMSSSDGRSMMSQEDISAILELPSLSVSVDSDEEYSLGYGSQPVDVPHHQHFKLRQEKPVRLKPRRSLQLMDTQSPFEDEDSTPKIVQRNKHLLDIQHPSPTDSGGASSVTLIGLESGLSLRSACQERLLLIHDDRLKGLETSVEYPLSSTRTSEVMPDERLDESVTVNSVEATCSSAPHLSALTTLDGTTSDLTRSSAITSSQGSSYKESDGFDSFSQNTSSDFEVIIPKTNMDLRGLGSESSAGSLQSCGLRVPVNSPNTSEPNLLAVASGKFDENRSQHDFPSGKNSQNVINKWTQSSKSEVRPTVEGGENNTCPAGVKSPMRPVTIDLGDASWTIDINSWPKNNSFLMACNSSEDSSDLSQDLKSSSGSLQSTSSPPNADKIKKKTKRRSLLSKIQGLGKHLQGNSGKLSDKKAKTPKKTPK